jgi:hypothetical protein
MMSRVLTAHRWFPALTAALLTTLAVAGPASAAGSGTSDQLEAGLTALVSQLGGSPSPAAVHTAKAALINSAFDDPVGGISAARTITDLDCVSRNLQQARNTTKKSTIKARFAGANACRADLAKLAQAAKATGLKSDLNAVSAKLKDLSTRALGGHAYGSRATALRKLQSSIVAKRFAGQTLHGVAFADVYDDVECIDVKIEAGRASGAASCAKRLLRRTKSLAPAKDPITFGSDLTGTPTTLPTAFAPDDTEFWTSALTVPADGMITTFRLKTGDSPVDLPLRFSVVRPGADGTVTVVTTSDPVYPLAAHDAGIHTYSTSGLKFVCCKAKKGDIVTVDNSGTTTQNAYVWFAPVAGATTFSHTSNGDSQNAGVVWQPITHAGYETLVQATIQPD